MLDVRLVFPLASMTLYMSKSVGGHCQYQSPSKTDAVQHVRHDPVVARCLRAMDIEGASSAWSRRAEKLLCTIPVVGGGTDDGHGLMADAR